MNRIERVVIHHSASGRSTTFAQIRRWHLERGFSDIGYHFVVLADGTMRQGRQLPTTGAHARGKNSTSIGICAVGDNTREDRRWTRSQQAALRELVDACRLLWPGIEVCGHRDVMARGHTECPGVDMAALGL